MQLTHNQARRLGRILSSLVMFINDTRHIVPEEDLLEATGDVTPQAFESLLPIVWDVPSLIDEFVKENPDGLDRADLDEALRWKDRLTGPQLLLGYDDQGRALFPIGDDIVAVCGIEAPCAREFSQPAPAPIDITLLPFEDLITYDSLLGGFNISFGPGMQKMVDNELEAMPFKRVVADAVSFIELARTENKRLRAEDLKSFEERVEHDRIENGGAEELPAGVHRGVLAGLSEEDRKHAVESSQDALTETGFAEGIRTSGIDHALHLAKLAQTHAPVLSLEETLNTDTKDVLQQDARRLGIKYAGKMRKGELAHQLAQRMVETDDELRDFLIDCWDEEFATLHGLLDMPEGMLAFPESAACEHMDIMPFPPYTRLYHHDKTFTALIPREFLAQLKSMDLGTITAERKRRWKIVHLLEVLTDMCGVVSLDVVATRCQELYGFVPSKEEILRDARREIEGGEIVAQFGLWARREGHEDELYVVHELLSNEYVMAVTKRRVEERAREAAELFSTGNASWEDVEKALDTNMLERDMRRDFSDRDAYVLDLLNEHEAKHELGPCPLDPMLAEVDALEWQEQIPEARNLRSWLNAHVPDGENDYVYADDVIDQLLMARNESDDPNHLLKMANELRLFTLTNDTQAIVGRIMALWNALPSWRNNGWSPRAVFERRVGRRIFYNPDGTEMHPGRNDPCPCGSGKKYKKCCGR